MPLSQSPLPIPTAMAIVIAKDLSSAYSNTPATSVGYYYCRKQIASALTGSQLASLRAWRLPMPKALLSLQPACCCSAKHVQVTCGSGDCVKPWRLLHPRGVRVPLARCCACEGFLGFWCNEARPFGLASVVIWAGQSGRVATSCFAAVV